LLKRKGLLQNAARMGSKKEGPLEWEEGNPLQVVKEWG